MYNDWFHIGRLTIHGYGVMIALGVVLAVTMTARRAKRRGLSDDAVYGIVLCLLIAGAVGAKLLYCLLHLSDVRADPALLIRPNGFLIYGGVVTGLLAMALYCKKTGLSFGAYFDLCMPGVALAQCLGRIGCFFAGCCYGRETQLPFAVVFPAGSIAPAGVPLWPTQLISSAGDGLICLLLLWYARRPRRPGSVGLLYLTLYGVGRFAVEFIRNDYQAVLGPLSYAQIISLAVAVVAAVLWLVRGAGPLSTKNT